MSTTKKHADFSTHQAIETRDEAYKGVMAEEQKRADRRGLGDRQRQVYEALVEAGPDGATNDELSQALNVPANAVTPRMYELRGCGDDNPLADAPLAFPLRKEGRLVKRPTRTGNRAQVWVAKCYRDPPAAQVSIMAAGGSGELTELRRATLG